MTLQVEERMLGNKLGAGSDLLLRHIGTSEAEEAERRGRGEREEWGKRRGGLQAAADGDDCRQGEDGGSRAEEKEGVRQVSR